MVWTWICFRNGKYKKRGVKMGEIFAFINHERWYKIGQGTYASGIPCSFLYRTKRR